MNSGTKLFLTLAGIGGALGTVLLFTTQKAKASPLPPAPEDHDSGDVVVVPEPGDDSPPIVVTPTPSNQHAPDAQRILLRWWAAEGQSLMFAEHSIDELRAQGFPLDYGSNAADLNGVWGPRNVAMAAAFENLSGLEPDDGQLTPKLVDALGRWAASQQLPPAQPASSPTEPAPIVIHDPHQGPVVVAPEPAPVPLPPLPQLPLPLPPAPPIGGDQGPPLPPLPPLPAEDVPGPPLPPLPVPPAPAPPAPMGDPEQPSLVSRETAELVSELLTAEATNTWKRKSAAVTAWQQARGLKPDGEFGPKSALTVAQEIGTVPIVRYWPKAAQKEKAVREYRAALLDLARAAAEPRASQLRISAQREQGQGFGSKQTALPLSQRVQIEQVG